jgi:hypothetical protein
MILFIPVQINGQTKGNLLQSKKQTVCYNNILKLHNQKYAKSEKIKRKKKGRDSNI